MLKICGVLGALFFSSVVVSAALDDKGVADHMPFESEGAMGGGIAVESMSGGGMEHFAADDESAHSMNPIRTKKMGAVRMSRSAAPPGMAFSKAEFAGMPSAMMADNGGGGRAVFGAPPQMPLGEELLSESGQSDFDAASVAKMLVRTGHLDLTVAASPPPASEKAGSGGPGALERLKASVEAAVAASPGAFVESSQSSGGWLDHTGRRQGESVSMTVRVPVDAFSGLRDAIKALAVPGSASVSNQSEQVPTLMHL